MIDSFRAHSSFPPRSLAPALLYGLITETYSISHYLPSSVSHFFSSSFLSSSDNPPTTNTTHPPPPPLQRLPNCATLFIPPRKGGCQSPRLPCLHPLTRRRTSPPSIHPRPIHQSFFSLSPSFFPPCLTHSCHFVTLLYIKFPLFLRSKLSSIYLHPPFSSLYCIQ